MRQIRGITEPTVLSQSMARRRSHSDAPPLEKWGDGKDRTLYLAVLETMDQQLGVIFNYVRNSKSLVHNTVILVCSDNGPEVGFGSAAPLRGHKATLYEGGIRSSLIAWAPGLMPKTAQGSRNHTSVFSTIDLVPSLLSITSTPAPKGVLFDGENLADTLLGKSKAARTKPLFFRRPPDRETFRHYSALPDLAVRSGQWKLYCDYDGRNQELYDLANDVSKQKQFGRQHPDIVARLTTEVLSWHASMPPDNGPALGRQQK
ncbi:MAG: sulfatase-like hydrolase/transferase [Fuerstiella sp.]|nr:sulfatase-like hydrolase/transferase [Fuerstiella sp.]